jgi:Tol biopolymer transport system component
VAFSSNAADLVAGDTNNNEDVFVYDRIQDTIERVSVDSDGIEGDFASSNPSISADGRYVAFQSEAKNLVPNDTNGDVDRSFGEDIFVYDRDTGLIERVSLRDNGGESNNASYTPSISGDGRYVAFVSVANNLVSGFQTGSGGNVYIHDRDTDEIVGIVVPFDLNANRDSLNPDFSTDGEYVAFEFSVNRSVGNGDDDYVYTDVYVYHRETRAVQRISGGLVGKNADQTDSRAPSISADGRYIAFQSNLESIDFYDSNSALDVFVHDRITGLSRRVSVDSSGEEGALNRDSTHPSISGDGRYVVFQSDVSSLVPSDTNASSDIFRKNLASGEVTLLSINAAAEQGDDSSFSPSASFDGHGVVFHSTASNLGSPDANGGLFISVTEGLSGPSPADLSLLAISANALSPCFSPNITSYHADVANVVESTLLKAAVAEPGASIEMQINGGGFSPLESNTASSPLTLVVGANVIEVKVTSEDGDTTRSYLVTVNRAASSNADLANLALESAVVLELAPDFDSGTTNYTASVPNTTAAVSVIPTAAQEEATITVNSMSVDSGASSSAIDLGTGENAINVLVTAGDGTTTMNYTVTVTRASNTAPVAAAQTVQVRQDKEKVIVLSGSDADGDELTYALVTLPANGSFDYAPPTLLYTPASGYSGNDSFTFKVNDGISDSLAATVTIEVIANQDPTALDDSAVTVQNTPVAINVLGNDFDPDGDFLTVMVNEQPAEGTATLDNGQIVYTPLADFTGNDSFTYGLSDGKGGVADAEVAVSVAPDSSVNQPPVAVDDAATTRPGEPLSINVTANDTDGDGDPLTVTIRTQPAHGTAAVNSNEVVYAPASGFLGEDSLVYAVSDGQGGEDTAIVSISIDTTDVGFIFRNGFE